MLNKYIFAGHSLSANFNISDAPEHFQFHSVLSTPLFQYLQVLQYFLPLHDDSGARPSINSEFNPISCLPITLVQDFCQHHLKGIVIKQNSYHCLENVIWDHSACWQIHDVQV